MKQQEQDTPDYLPIIDYLPHRDRMVLLDRMLEASAERVLCAVTLREDSPFCRDGRVPAYVGIEYMAQAAGALMGWYARSQGGLPKIGFLTSVRKFSFMGGVDGFAVGMTLTVEARELLRDDDNGLGVMACAIYHPGSVLVAKTQLTAYMPKDLDAYSKTI
ncbi:MAG: hypothetical protein LBT71_06360 [Azoarcus sp.]|jgi:predicted hotdog family 3-hydroxylacyl-ACP dehydratase|nr:hypothetical protein [Azoarcus sp.]